MKRIEILQKHCVFHDNYSCYVLLAVSRKKDTPEITNSQEIVFREVIKNKKDIIRKYNKIKSQIINYKNENDKPFPFYLYVSVNGRDARKATFILINQIDCWIHEELQGVENSRMFKKIYGHFYSALMKRESRSKGRLFMIDYDEKENIESFLNKLESLKINVKYKVETKNGYHIITYPFDRNMLKQEEYCDVKDDANLFVEYIKNGR